MKIIEKLSYIISFFIDLLYPPVCMSCSSLLLSKEKQRGFCGKCYQNVMYAGRSYCLSCGKLLVNDTKEFCKSCEEKLPDFDQGRAVYGYSGAVKKSLYQFKYGNKRVFAKYYGGEVERNLTGWINRCAPDVIIPIPMYNQKKKQRGYNQAEIFARDVGKRFEIPVGEKIVRRNVNTKPMKQLNKAERVKNLQNVFTIEENVVKFKKVLLVDDIYTTGATMNEVSKVLKAAGVKQIFCLCVATAIEEK